MIFIFDNKQSHQQDRINLFNTTFLFQAKKETITKMQVSKKKNKFTANRSLSMNEQLSFFNNLSSHTINQEEEYEQQKDQPPQRQIGIFQEFKMKYDQLRKQNLEKRSQIDELRRINKRLQIQLLNINTDFYDREIKRLRGQVEKYQQQSENYKFKYFQAENKRKQHQASLNVKETQLTRLIKQLQVEKVKSAQQKAQIKENQKKYLSIINTVEESSMKSAQHYAQCEKKLILCQSQLKKSKTQLQQTIKKLQKQEKQKQYEKQQSQKVIDKQNIEIQKLSQKLVQSEQFSKKQQKEISNFKQQISSLTIDLVKTKSLLSFETNKTYEKITQFRSTKILQIQNKKYKQQLDILRRQSKQKSLTLKQIQNHFNQIKQQMQIEKKQNEQKIKQLGNKKAVIEKHYQSKVLGLNKEIQTLKMKYIKLQSQIQYDRAQMIKGSNLRKPQQQTNTMNNQQLITVHNQFQLILKNKQLQILQLKQQLQKKTIQLGKLLQQSQDYQSNVQQLKDEITLLQKKLAVSQKNLINRQQITTLELKGEVQTLKKRLEMTQMKVEIKSRQIKGKDKFILQSIVHRHQSDEKQSHSTQLIIAELQRVLENELIEQLVKAQKRIKSLEGK